MPSSPQQIQIHHHSRLYQDMDADGDLVLSSPAISVTCITSLDPLPAVSYPNNINSSPAAAKKKTAITGTGNTVTAAGAISMPALPSLPVSTPMPSDAHMSTSPPSASASMMTTLKRRMSTNTGTRRRVSSSGSGILVESSPRSGSDLEIECGSGSEADDGGKRPRRDIRLGGDLNTAGVRRRRSLRVLDGRGAEALEVADADGRPYKRPRIENVQSVDNVDVSVSVSRPASDEEDVREKAKMRTTENNTFAPVPVSPFSRPCPSRFQTSSSSSSSKAGSPFPTTPPSNASGNTPAVFTPNPGCTPQPFWLDDGDLVLLISPSPASPTAMPNSVQSRHASLPTPSPVPSPVPSYFSPFLNSSQSNSWNQNQEAVPPTTSAFRIHAARLALASTSFASLLASPLPISPNREDSIRAAREIAGRLNARNRNGRGGGTEYNDGYTKAKHGEMYAGQTRNGDGEDFEYFGGCPSIRLEGDSPRDWVIALEAIYEPMSFQVRPVVFDTLAGALRISTRFGIRQLREWALAQLRTTWPSKIERMAPVALPHAADAIALARACDVPDILPAAFYALAVQRWRPSPVHGPGPTAVSSSRSPRYSGMPLVSFAANSNASANLASSFNLASGCVGEAGGTDGGRAHAVLDPMDMRRLVAGRETLQDILVEIVAAPLVIGSNMRSGDEVGVTMEEMMSGSGMNVSENATYPPSPAPSPSPKSSFAITMSRASVNVSSGTSMTMMNLTMGSSMSTNSNSTFHQPVPEHSFSSFSSFDSSNTSLGTFPSSSSSFGFSESSSGSSVDSTGNPPFASFSQSPRCDFESAHSTSKPIFTFCPSSTSSCRSTLETLWRTRLVAHGRRAWGTWLARELHRLATLPRSQFLSTGASSGSGFGLGEDSEDRGYGAEGSVANGKTSTQGQGQALVCVRCWEENRRLALWRLDWLCEAIPGMFMLKV